MGHRWMTKKALRSIQHPSSSRLFVLLITLLIGMWIGSSFTGSQMEPQQEQQRHDQEQSMMQPSPETKVEKEELNLVIIIMSAKPHKEKRNACRTTWIQLVDYRPVRHFFVIGSMGIDSMDMSQLLQENETHADLLILPQVADSYAGLTSKLLTAIKYIDQRFSFKFLLKVDDDSFVRLDTLYDEVSELKNHRIYWGYFNAGAPVKKAGAWKETQWFMCDKYLPYAVGGGYLLSNDLVHYVAQNGDLLQQYNSEDVSLGTWLSPLHINRRHDVRFDTWYKSRGCCNTFLIMHKQTPGLMQDRYQALEAFGTLCKREKYQLAYLYDWSVLPSQCCNKRESPSHSEGT